MNEIASITIAPMLSDTNTLVIYRNDGNEITVKINKENKTKAISSTQKLEEYEVNFIRENYL